MTRAFWELGHACSCSAGRSRSTVRSGSSTASATPSSAGGRVPDVAGAAFIRCPAECAQGRRSPAVGAARDRRDPAHRRRPAGARILIHLLLAAAAAAAPVSLGACPDLVIRKRWSAAPSPPTRRGTARPRPSRSRRPPRHRGTRIPGRRECGRRPGNMWIADNQPAKAAADLDKALAGGGLQGIQRGEAVLDRPARRRRRAISRRRGARTTEAGQTISSDPVYRRSPRRSRSARATTNLASRDHPRLVAGARRSVGAVRGGRRGPLQRRGRAGPELLAARRGQRPWRPDRPVGSEGDRGIGGHADGENRRDPRARGSAEVVVDGCHDADLLEGRASSRRAAVIAILAVAGANREIALARGLEATDVDSAVARELLGAVASVAGRLGNHPGLEAVEAREGVGDVAARQLDSVTQQLGLPRISGPGAHHIGGPQLD